MRLENITVGTPTEPFDLAAAKAHLVVHNDLDDTLISAQITAARVAAETYTGRVIAPAAYRLTLDSFMPSIEIPKSEFISVTKLDYVDRDGTTQTLSPADYSVRYCKTCRCIVPAYNTQWPATEPGFDKVTLEFDAGYAAGTVPADLVAAIKLILGELYLHREDSVDGIANNAVPITSQHLMRPYRLVHI